MAETTTQARILRGIRRLGPWLVGVAIVLFIATRVPLDQFRSSIRHGSHLALATIDFLIPLVTLFTDTFATWIGLIALRLRRPLGKVLVIRGASYVLFLINYALGQGGFGYYLHRTGARPLRAVGATLFLIGTNLATLLVLTTLAWGFHGSENDPTMWWTLMAGCAAFGVYLVVIAWSPGAIARREIFGPLFDAGIRGHAAAMVARVPHVAVMVIGIWLAMRVWGIPVPFVTGVAIMPVVVIASVLPIAPAGLGTTQAALVYFFAPYAVGVSAEDRAAAVLAFSIVHFVYGVVGTLLVGLACLPFARHAGLVPPRDAAVSGT